MLSGGVAIRQVPDTMSRDTLAVCANMCVGPETGTFKLDNAERDFKSMAELLEGRPPLSTLVKIDIEGVSGCVVYKCSVSVVQCMACVCACLSLCTCVYMRMRKCVCARKCVRLCVHVPIVPLQTDAAKMRPE